MASLCKFPNITIPGPPDIDPLALLMAIINGLGLHLPALPSLPLLPPAFCPLD
jgi:hypothetical protein